MTLSSDEPFPLTFLVRSLSHLPFNVIIHLTLLACPLPDHHLVAIFNVWVSVEAAGCHRKNSAFSGTRSSDLRGDEVFFGNCTAEDLLVAVSFSLVGHVPQLFWLFFFKKIKPRSMEWCFDILMNWYNDTINTQYTDNCLLCCCCFACWTSLSCFGTTLPWPQLIALWSLDTFLWSFLLAFSLPSRIMEW